MPKAIICDIDDSLTHRLITDFLRIMGERKGAALCDHHNPFRFARSDSYKRQHRPTKQAAEKAQAVIDIAFIDLALIDIALIDIALLDIA